MTLMLALGLFILVLSFIDMLGNTGWSKVPGLILVIYMYYFVCYLLGYIKR